MPERVFQKLNERIRPQWKACFFAAVIVGLLSHFYKITNWLPNWDSLVFRYDSQNMLELGRWLLPLACAPGSFYDVPFLNGAFCILYHAAGAVVICKILGVKERVTAALIGALVVSFPTVTSVMMYNYVADGYGLSFLLACLSAERIAKEKSGWISGAVLLAASAGIYQAYITVTVLLLALYLAEKLVFEGVEIVKLIKKGLVFLGSGALGIAIYYVVMHLLLLVSGTELLEYQGLNSAASMSGINLLASLYTISKTFLDFFFDFSKGASLFVILNVLICAVTATMYLYYAVKNKGIHHIPRVLLLGVIGIVLVLGGTVLAFANAWIDYHNLMLMGYCVFYLFFVILYEKGKVKGGHRAITKWAVLLVSAVLIFNQVVIANVSYHKAQLAYEKSYGALIRIADRIEQTEQASGCTRILVSGALSESEAYSVDLPPDITGITDGYILRADDETVGQSVLTAALNDYCGKEYDFVSGEEKSDLLQNPEITNMPSWPDAGSVAVKDGIIIIKF